MALINFTAYIFDWVRVYEPTEGLSYVRLRTGSNAAVLYRTATQKPPRDYVDGQVVTPAQHEVEVTVPSGEGLYARCMGVRSCQVWVERQAVPITDLTLASISGWASYVDTEFTEENPFELTKSMGQVPIPNNAGFVIDREKPDGLDTFYDGQRILGHSGDAVAVTIRFKVKPRQNPVTILETGTDIGGDFGVIFRESFQVPKKKNVIRDVNYNYTGYQLDTWEANGGLPVFSSDRRVEVFDISLLVHRIHKARNTNGA